MRAQSGFFWVETQEQVVVSHLAGRLKQEWKNSSLVAVGDRVVLSVKADGTGIIEEVMERKSVLSRTRTSATGRNLLTDQEQVLVANPDQVVFVFSIRQPIPSLRKLDRFLVVAERNHLPAIICVTKMDIVPFEYAHQQFRVYEEIGYPVLFTSATNRTGIEELRVCLQGKISVLSGSSGVGKSSLLNVLQPGLGLKVQAVSKTTDKGLHTTRHAELFKLDGGGYVADTPGIRSLALFDLEPGELDGYFREIAPLVAACQFSDCTHRHEPNCAVRTAVSQNRISKERYESYLRLREEHQELDDSVY